MIPPTSIDGTDITGATIDGTDVTEITVDGDTVFTAGASLQDIVAPGNLVTWLPMENGGDDETRTGGALDNAGISVADSSDYSHTIDGSAPSFAASDGVTDLQNGPNSTAFENNGSNGYLEGGTSISSPFTVSFWIYMRSLSGLNGLIMRGPYFFQTQMRNGDYAVYYGSYRTIITSPTTNKWYHIAISYDTNDDWETYVDGTLTNSFNASATSQSFARLMWYQADGYLDDWRHYNTVLTSSQIDQIYQNTKP